MDFVYPLLSEIAQAQGVEVLELDGDVEGFDVDDLRFSMTALSNSTSNCTTVDITHWMCSHRYNHRLESTRVGLKAPRGLPSGLDGSGRNPPHDSRRQGDRGARARRG